MSVAVATGALNLALGTVYFSYGLMTIVDLKRGWKSHGFSHFGLAWIAMAFTCGPHHLDHGAHIILSGRVGGPLDLLAIAVGAPAGITWFLLRAEAMMGGKGDRFVRGNPLWIDLLPVVGIVYVAALGNATLAVLGDADGFEPRVIPNLLLIFLYGAIGAQLARTQLANRPHTGGWSLSGTSLATVMFTCAVMHGVHAVYATEGRYDIDIHGYAIDILSVPAACYFLWVVWSLHRGAFRDWNDGDDVSAPKLATTAEQSLAGVG